jgi:hypothetical protein
MARRRRRSALVDVVAIVSRAREAARAALNGLRAEIRKTRVQLEKLMESERSFRSELFGGAGPGRSRSAGRSSGAARTAKPRRKGPPRADTFFKKLPSTFTIENVRKVAGRLAGISLAQWSRAKKVRKVGKGYQKVG